MVRCAIRSLQRDGRRNERRHLSFANIPRWGVWTVRPGRAVQKKVIKRPCADIGFSDLREGLLKCNRHGQGHDACTYQVGRTAAQ